MYLALARKLRFLQKEHLEKLHFNPSFNIPGTEMRAALHILEPPPRQFLIQEVRLTESQAFSTMILSIILFVSCHCH